MCRFSQSLDVLFQTVDGGEEDRSGLGTELGRLFDPRICDRPRSSDLRFNADKTILEIPTEIAVHPGLPGHELIDEIGEVPRVLWVHLLHLMDHALYDAVRGQPIKLLLLGVDEQLETLGGLRQLSEPRFYVLQLLMI